MKFHEDILKLDVARVTKQLCEAIRRQVRDDLKKSGAVVGISGGIDSTVVSALCARALGPERVLGVMMPEQESSGESETLARQLAAQFGFEAIKEDITGGLTGLSCYEKRDEAIKQLFPMYDKSYKCKITIPESILSKDTFNFFHLTIQKPGEEANTKRMTPNVYAQVVAASNLKQRLRMTTLYYHAERCNWAVAGTGNKDEHMQGFFVKYGDGGADFKPIANLFKIQVYQLAEYLGVPTEIIKRIPTTDTYSAGSTQEEFFFGLDFYRMDMLWHAMETNVPAAEAAKVLGISVQEAEHGYAHIARKIQATEPLRLPPLEIDLPE